MDPLLQRVLAGTCRVQPVIACDSSLVPNSAEAEGRGRGGEVKMRIVEEELWRVTGLQMEREL